MVRTRNRESLPQCSLEGSSSTPRAPPAVMQNSARRLTRIADAILLNLGRIAEGDTIASTSCAKTRTVCAHLTLDKRYVEIPLVNPYSLYVPAYLTPRLPRFL